MRLFVTGTDTGVGKTYVCRLLIRGLAARGESVAPYKPFCCGDRTDAHLLLEAARAGERPFSLTLDDVNPIWLKPALSPLAASLIENRGLDLDALILHARKLEEASDHLIVEGAGGWEVPLTREAMLSDFAARLGYPVAVVVDNKLGALNHAILTVRSIQSRGLKCAGLVLNHVRPERDAASISNRLILDAVLGLPILAEMLHDAEEIDVQPFLDETLSG